MNCQKRALTNTQQAPPEVQSSRLVPVKSASSSAHGSSGGTTCHNSHAQSSVSSVLYQVENRLCLSQASTPTSVTGGARLLPVVRGAVSACISAIAQRSTSAMRRLYQFMKAEVSRLRVRYTAMVMAITSTAWPVWLSTIPVNTLTKSG